VTNNLAEALNERKQKGLKGSRVLLLGVAYKRNVDDMRESPSLKIWERFEEKGAIVDYHDPYLPEIPTTREHETLAERQSVELTPRNLRDYDAVFVATDHDDVDYELISKSCDLIIDSRNVFERKGIKGDNIIKT